MRALLIVGKTNLDEFAMGSSNENSGFGPVKNPWNTGYVPGGSSGGSSAAIASGCCLGALGTDTGGSIRQPASLCGVVGMKPTYGRVSRYGVIAFASSLDQVGPFGQSVWDTARLLEVMAGSDSFDATCSERGVPRYSSELEHSNLKGIKLGVVTEWMKEGIDANIIKSFEEALEGMKKQGAEIIDVSLPHSRYALSTYYLIAPCEASSNLARYDGVHYGKRKEDDGDFSASTRGVGFGSEVKLRVMLGTYALSSGYYDSYYLKANQVRALIQSDFDTAFSNCDAIVSPTSPSTAFALGERSEDPIKMYLSDIFTLPVNLAELPGISVPCGLDKSNLPIGLQFITNRFAESTLFKVSHAYEKLRGPFSHPPHFGSTP